MVRELWLGGVPDNIDEEQIRGILANFGNIQKIELFSKFAFVKYMMATDATNAFAKAANIHQQFGNRQGFAIAFSNPKKRQNTVGNNEAYERQSTFLPILFLGFHGVTSANVQ